MNDFDSRLTEALQADPPPVRDARFRIEVLLRIERARFKRRLIATVAVTVAAAALTAVNAQAIVAWIATDNSRLWIVGVGAIVAMFSLSGVPINALPGFRTLSRILLDRWLYP